MVKLRIGAQNNLSPQNKVIMIKRNADEIDGQMFIGGFRNFWYILGTMEGHPHKQGYSHAQGYAHVQRETWEDPMLSPLTDLATVQSRS